MFRRRTHEGRFAAIDYESVSCGRAGNALEACAGDIGEEDGTPQRKLAVGVRPATQVERSEESKVPGGAGAKRACGVSQVVKLHIPAAEGQRRAEQPAAQFAERAVDLCQQQRGAPGAPHEQQATGERIPFRRSHQAEVEVDLLAAERAESCDGILPRSLEQRFAEFIQRLPGNSGEREGTSCGLEVAREGGVVNRSCRSLHELLPRRVRQGGKVVLQWDAKCRARCHFRRSPDCRPRLDPQRGNRNGQALGLDPGR